MSQLISAQCFVSINIDNIIFVLLNYFWLIHFHLIRWYIGINFLFCPSYL